MAKRTSLALRYDLGGRAERALRAIGAQDDDDLAAIDIGRLRGLRAIGQGTIHEIQMARTKLMQSRHGTGYSDALTVPLMDPEAHAALARSLGLTARASRALEVLGIDCERKLMDLNFETASEVRGVNWGALKEVRAAREKMMIARLDGHRVLVDRIGPDESGRTPVDFTGEILWVDSPACRETAKGRLSVPYAEVLTARERRETQREERARQRQAEANAAPFDERAFRTKHRLNPRAMTTLRNAGVRSDADFAAVDLDALAATRSVGARTMDIIRRARIRMATRPGDEEDRARRLREARGLAKRLKLSRDTVDILAQAGAASREDLVSMDLMAQMDLHRRGGRISSAVKNGLAEIRDVQHRLINGLGEDVTADDRLVNSIYLELASRHGLTWRAAKAFSIVEAATDDDLAALDFDRIARVEGVGAGTVQKIRKARTRMMKTRHGEDYEDERTRLAPADDETQLADMLELSPRAACVLETLGIHTVPAFLDLNISSARNLNGVGRETVNELFEARAGLIYDLAGIARVTGTLMRESQSGKGLLVEFGDGEQLWMPKAKCTEMGGGRVSVPRGLLQVSRDWMNKSKPESPDLMEDMPEP